MRSNAFRYTGALALAMLCAAADATAGRDEPLPYRVFVMAEWGHPAGPESFRAELEREILMELTAAGCFRAVDVDAPSSPGPDDLTLRVAVHAYEEEIDFEYGVAQRAQPGADLDRLKVASVRADFRVELRTAVEDAAVRDKRFRQVGSWRPVYHEDPREEAQRLLIEGVARTTRKFACKGKSDRWSKELETARATPAR
jgi:hypothetical protein